MHKKIQKANVKEGLLSESKHGIFKTKEWGCWTAKSGKIYHAFTKSEKMPKAFKIKFDDYMKIKRNPLYSDDWLILKEHFLFGVIKVKTSIEGVMFTESEKKFFFD